MNERPLDIIHIRDLKVRCVLGVSQEERRDKQDVVLNIHMHADLEEPCLTDRVSDSVDYKAVKKAVIELVEGSSFCLVERLAAKVAELCLADRRVRKVEVTVDKPGALRIARSVGVTIVRERHEGS